MQLTPLEEEGCEFTPEKYQDFDLEDTLFMSKKTTSFESYFDSLQSTSLKGEGEGSDYSYQVTSYQDRFLENIKLDIDEECFRQSLKDLM
jgi:hypothetical protein